MIKAIIFDMDGLMVDSETVTYEGCKYVLNKLGLDITKDFYKTTLGKTVKEGRQLYRDQYPGIDLNALFEEVYDYMDDVFTNEGVPIKKGLIELLEYLTDHNYIKMVASSSTREHVEDVLSKADVLKYIDDSICGDEVINGKPNPEIFIKACEKLNINRDEAIVLEDSEAGIEAAYNGHIPVICIPDMKYPDQKHIDMTYCLLDDLSQVINLLESKKLA